MSRPIPKTCVVYPLIVMETRPESTRLVAVAVGSELVGAFLVLRSGLFGGCSAGGQLVNSNPSKFPSARHPSRSWKNSMDPPP